jgi:hypothetical protein
MLRKLKPGERVTVCFKIPHPFADGMTIDCTADVMIVRNRLDYVRLFCRDPRYPDAPAFSYRLDCEKSGFKIPLPAPSINIVPVREIREMTREDYEDAIIEQEIHIFFVNNMREILHN